jgi:hypothetical protein
LENSAIASSSPSHPDWVLKFDSIHDIINAEKLFKVLGVWCDLIPTPRPISSDCGMVLKFRFEDLDKIRNLKTNVLFKPRALFECRGNEFIDKPGRLE